MGKLSSEDTLVLHPKGISREKEVHGSADIKQATLAHT